MFIYLKKNLKIPKRQSEYVYWRTDNTMAKRKITCCKHFPVLSSFMTYHLVCNQITTLCATSGTGTANPSGAPEFTPGFSGVRVTWSLVLYAYFCRSLFVLLLIFFSPLCCLFFFDIRILINTLVYSNSSYKRTNNDLQNICIKLNIE